jgi:hypothetical protein
MGGLFTILKVREGITDYRDPGWYRHPEGTVASLADANALRRDQIDANGPPDQSDEHSGHHHS